jgi:hypothetical protein
MIKTLRITSIIVAIVAGILLVFPVVFGIRSNGQVEKLLGLPDAIEKFSKAKTNKTAIDGDSMGGGPLVKQAQFFAKYLNPPEPKINPADKRGGNPAPLGLVDAKYTLMGTSFFAAHPELSLAFIDEPGKGFRWVRQSNQIGHLFIEQIKDGLIVVRDGKRTYEIIVQKSQDVSEALLASTSPVTLPMQPGKSFVNKGSSISPVQRAGLKRISRSINKADTSDVIENNSSEPQLSEEQSAVLESFIEKLKSLKKENKSDKIDFNEPDSANSGEPNLVDSSETPKNEHLEKIISEYQSERVSEEEAEKLGNLGEELQEEESK